MRFTKLFITAFVILLLIAVCSLSAFALSEPLASYDFTLSSYPMHPMTQSGAQQSMNYFIQTSDYEVYYIELWFTSGSSRYGTSQWICPFGVTRDGNNSVFSFLPVIKQNWLSSSQLGSAPFEMYIYNTSGQLVKSFTSYIQDLSGNSSYIVCDRIYELNASDYFYLTPQTFNSYYLITVPSSASGVDIDSSNLPILHGYYYNTTWSPEFTYDFMDLLNPTLSPGYSSITSPITVNGVTVYQPFNTPGGGVGQVLPGSSTGSATSDGNGGYTITVENEPFQYDGDFNTVTLPENPTLPTIADDITDDFDGLEWFITLFDTICRRNNKIFAVIVLSLSIGVATLILNKKR